MPTLRQIYFDSNKQLNDDKREIEIRILLTYINGIKSMSDFYLRMDEEVEDLKLYNSLFKRYLSGEPIGYLINETTFCGDKFVVDKSTLIPRMETEEVVNYSIQKIHQIFGEKTVNLIDVCTGSGCLGIEVAKNTKVNNLYLTDIDENCLKVATKNARNLIPNIDTNILCGDALEPIINNLETIDVIVANPPYILSKKETYESVLKFEPHKALFTTEKLDVYSSILGTLSNNQNNVKLIVFELGDEIRDSLEDLIKETLPNAQYEFKKDINGKWRICGIIL